MPKRRTSKATASRAKRASKNRDKGTEQAATKRAAKKKSAKTKKPAKRAVAKRSTRNSTTKQASTTDAPKNVGSTETSSANQRTQIIQFDPGSIQTAHNYPTSPEPQLAHPRTVHSHIPVSAEALVARDELIDKLGGRATMNQVRSFGAAETGGSGLENICGVGIGLKETHGGITGDLSVKVFVREKLSASRVTKKSWIPTAIAGMPTDVEQADTFLSASHTRRYPRAVPGGVSCGHFLVAAGTLGSLVVLNDDRLAILSNNHILANENNARKGDQILQPAVIDGGRPSNPGSSISPDVIATLERFVRIDPQSANLVDAAVAWTSFRHVRSSHLTYVGDPTPVQAAPLMVVRKDGRTSESTTGFISAIHVNGVPINYRFGSAIYNDQIIIRGLAHTVFSKEGDSGSLVVTATTQQPVGMICAGGASHSVANPIGTVMSQLGIKRFATKDDENANA